MELQTRYITLCFLRSANEPETSLYFLIRPIQLCKDCAISKWGS
jgi:hypothetical protein